MVAVRTTPLVGFDEIGFTVVVGLAVVGFDVDNMTGRAVIGFDDVGFAVGLDDVGFVVGVVGFDVVGFAGVGFAVTGKLVGLIVGVLIGQVSSRHRPYPPESI